ncbi:hypothetical protein KUTeg_024639 [Tegillarca granosa]|uniref:DUF7042 domain-containing protein n=1 Tax=Tegillarca granosa TaxID=220873 RepID=A0ABQ9E469_TEGGR|nr:hypothetical protein KUTeg_024639 [Tegillarca granosa]
MDSQCTFPTSWDSLWYDSSITGDLTIDQSQLRVTGWTRVMATTTITTWVCTLEDTSNNYLVFRSTNQFALDFGVMYYAYLCIHWTKVTDNSFYYYVRADQQASASNERVYVVPASQTQPSTASTVCIPSNVPATEEFNMMVKQGEIINVKQQCPPPFLGTFTYTYNDGSSHCGSNSSWDVCSTKNTMTFDYTACSTKVAFTSEGVVHCVANISSGSTYYAYTINPGTIDNTNYYRFACFIAYYFF